MEILKKTSTSIEVNADGHLSILQVTKIMEGDQILTTQNHRTTAYPGKDLDAVKSCMKEDPDGFALLDSIANTIWTPEVVQAYQDQFNEET